MEPQHLAELRHKESTYWWHVNKRLIVTRLLRDATPGPGSILEVGCGGGLLSSILAQDGWNVVVADLQSEAIRYARRSEAVRGVRFDADRGWPLADQRFDAALMLDVLEHLEDDRAVLRELERVLRPGGTAVITVPAHQFLFSKWDELLGHKRRHQKRRLRSILEEAGLQVRRLSYWNLIALPPALLLRGRDRLFGSRQQRAEFPPVSKWVNRCLTQWGRFEGSLLERFDQPMGLSLVTVVQKKMAPVTVSLPSDDATGQVRRIVGDEVPPRRRAVFRMAQRFAGVCLRMTGLEGVAARNTLDYRVTRREARFAKLPAAFEGVRVLHLSDLHIDGIIDGGRKLFETIDGLEFDLCVLTGDYRFGRDGRLPVVVDLMKELVRHLECRHGVLAILGDHDALAMVSPFEEMGIRVLLNESTSVSQDGETLWIAGVDGRSPLVCEPEKAMDGVPSSACTIVLLHSPDDVRHVARLGADFCLAGHTHGGQLCLPSGIPVVKNSRCRWRQARGAWSESSMSGYTSRGIGASGLNARLFCPPEVVLHELRVALPRTTAVESVAEAEPETVSVPQS